MKPRTELEKRVVSLSEHLPLITTSQEQWAKKHCFERIAYRCKNEMWCTVCGGKWIDATGQKKGYITCPHCGVKLKVNVSTRKNLSEASYMTIVTISEEFQVLRHIYKTLSQRES
jgi:DNA-directed RNA polymerase subunit RPC12/RpoP